MFNDFDPLVLHSLIRFHKPKLVVEIGSGYSTRVIARAARLNASTQVVVVDRYPGEVVREGIPGVDQLINADVHEAEPSIFARLGQGDILFIDTSHVVRCASEVNYLFFEVIPRLNPGVMVHVHDIFFPNDYPRSWVVDLKLFWTEQYLLQAFLAFNSEFQVLFCNSFMAARHTDEMRSIFPQSPHVGGTSFWMVRRSGSAAVADR
jgi:hypothetical protein